MASEGYTAQFHLAPPPTKPKIRIVHSNWKWSKTLVEPIPRLASENYFSQKLQINVIRQYLSNQWPKSPLWRWMIILRVQAALCFVSVPRLLFALSFHSELLSWNLLLETIEGVTEGFMPTLYRWTKRPRDVKGLLQKVHTAEQQQRRTGM